MLIILKLSYLYVGNNWLETGRSLLFAVVPIVKKFDEYLNSDLNLFPSLVYSEDCNYFSCKTFNKYSKK